MSDDRKVQVIENREHLLQRLAEVVGAYGADLSRWPVADRHALKQLLAADREAQQLVSQARSLDRLLDFADRTVVAPSVLERLSDRIMARLEPEHADKDAYKRPAVGEVIAFPGRLRPVASPARKQNQSTKRGQQGWAASHWLQRAALVASLTIGIFIGAAGYLEETAQSVTALAGLDISLEAGAPIDDGFGAPEEDFL